MTVRAVSPLRLEVSNPSTGSATVSGRTSRMSTGSVDLTLERTSETEATLKGQFGTFDNGRCDLKMVREGDKVTITGRVGFGQWSPVKLVFTKSEVTGNLAGELGSVRLAVSRVANATSYVGKVGAYEQTHTGSVSLNVINGEVRQYVGSTSRKTEGEVKLHEKLEGDRVLSNGYISRSFDGQTELSRPAAMRRLELVDTTLLLILVQAMRRQLASI